MPQLDELRSVDYLALGHVTADVGPDDSVSPGGGVYYAAAVASTLGLRTGVVTRAARGAVPADGLSDVSFHVVPTAATTTFANQYDAAGNRSQCLLDVADPLEPSDVPQPWRRVGVLHVAPVVHEVGPEVVRTIEADFVGLTPQGWLRTIEVGKAVTPRPWSVPDSIIERADAIVLSDEDLGGDERRLPWLAERVPFVVITRGSGGAQGYFEGRSVLQPAVAADAAHPTGAGDSFAAALFVGLWEGVGPADALRFAAAAAAFAIERPGPADLPGRQAVRRRGELE